MRIDAAFRVEMLAIAALHDMVINGVPRDSICADLCVEVSTKAFTNKKYK